MFSLVEGALIMPVSGGEMLGGTFSRNLTELAETTVIRSVT